MPPIMRMQPAVELRPRERVLLMVREDGPGGGVEGRSAGTIAEAQDGAEDVLRRWFAPLGDATDDEITDAVDMLLTAIRRRGGASTWSSDALGVTVTISEH